MKKKSNADDADFTSTPSIHYKKFFDKFSEINTLEPSKWKAAHLIGYFVKRYKDQYGVDYSFKFNAAPSKSYEVYQLSRVAASLSTDPVTLKEYIDWIFDTKIVGTNKRITAIGFLANNIFITDFKFKYMARKEVRRDSFLPPPCLEALSNLNLPSCETYGSLAFLVMAAQDDGADPKYLEACQKLKALGFDFSILEKLK